MSQPLPHSSSAPSGLVRRPSIPATPDRSNFFAAVRGGNAQGAKLLMPPLEEINNPDPKGEGETALMIAAGKSAQMVHALLDAKADVHGKGKFGGTPLSQAADAGNEETTRLLLSAKADPNQIEEFNGMGSPLAIALNKGHMVVARLLLEEGATPSPRVPMDFPVFKQALQKLCLISEAKKV
jgi:ankyrin repeat protein